LEKVVSREIFRSEARAWASRIGVEPKEVHIRPLKRKWGSCSSAGRLTPDSHRLSEPASVRKRVMVEELLHVKVPNHGRLFRALLWGRLETEKG